MAYSVDFRIDLGSTNTGLSLTATIETMTGSPVTSGLTGMVEDPSGSGVYWWTYAAFVDATSYRVLFYSGATLKASTAVSPSDASSAVAQVPLVTPPPTSGVIFSGTRLRRSFTFVDVAGTPADPTTVTVTVVAPDGTVTTPVAVNTGVGAYYVDVTFDQAGTWQLRPFGTGAVTMASRLVQLVWP